MTNKSVYPKLYALVKAAAKECGDRVNEDYHWASDWDYPVSAGGLNVLLGRLTKKKVRRLIYGDWEERNAITNSVYNQWELNVIENLIAAVLYGLEDPPRKDAQLASKLFVTGG